MGSTKVASASSSIPDQATATATDGSLGCNRLHAPPEKTSSDPGATACRDSGGMVGEVVEICSGLAPRVATDALVDSILAVACPMFDDTTTWNEKLSAGLRVMALGSLGTGKGAAFDEAVRAEEPSCSDANITYSGSRPQVRTDGSVFAPPDGIQASGDVRPFAVWAPAAVVTPKATGGPGCMLPEAETASALHATAGGTALYCREAAPDPPTVCSHAAVHQSLATDATASTPSAVQTSKASHNPCCTLGDELPASVELTIEDVEMSQAMTVPQVVSVPLPVATSVHTVGSLPAGEPEAARAERAGRHSPSHGSTAPLYPKTPTKGEAAKQMPSRDSSPAAEGSTSDIWEAPALQASPDQGVSVPGTRCHAMAALRKRYHSLSRLLHPDKCPLPGAPHAFASLHRAYKYIGASFDLESEAEAAVPVQGPCETAQASSEQNRPDVGTTPDTADVQAGSVVPDPSEHRGRTVSRELAPAQMMCA